MPPSAGHAPARTVRSSVAARGVKGRCDYGGRNCVVRAQLASRCGEWVALSSVCLTQSKPRPIPVAYRRQWQR